jgi:peptidoglycan/LPS O-acetylase OafA/YrhL
MLSVMGVCFLFRDQSAIARFYSNPILLECIFGLLSYYCVRYAVSRITPAMKPALFAAVVGSMILLPAIEEWQLLQSLPEILQYAPLCFVLICSICLLASLGADLKAGPIVLLGDASYVMYLTHPYVIQFLDRVVGRVFPAFHVDSTVGVVFAMMLVMPLSVWLYLKIDKPVVVYLNNLLCGRKRPDPASYVAPLQPVAPHATPLVSQASAS